MFNRMFPTLLALLGTGLAQAGPACPKSCEDQISTLQGQVSMLASRVPKSEAWPTTGEASLPPPNGPSFMATGSKTFADLPFTPTFAIVYIWQFRGKVGSNVSERPVDTTVLVYTGSFSNPPVIETTGQVCKFKFQLKDKTLSYELGGSCPANMYPAFNILFVP
jgi:hypothetical protein